MKAHHRYTRALLSSFFVLLMGGITTAVFVDPFGVFGVTAIDARNAEPNTRYLKIEYLKEHPRYDGFVFGTSRSNAYRPKILNELTGRRFYNLNVQSETPAGMLAKLRWLIQHMNPKVIFVGLDFDELDQTLLRDPADLQRQEHPAVSGTSVLSFFYSYLWPNPQHIAIALYGRFFNPVTWYRFDLATGRHSFPYYREWMNTNPESYVASRLQEIEGKRPYRPNPEHMKRLRETVELARRDGIEMVVAVNPTNHRLFGSYQADVYTAWLRELVDIVGEVWDFSGLNSVTRNDRLYYDVSHFTAAVGDMALRRVFASKDAQTGSPRDFGVLLTRRNIAERSRAMAELLSRPVVATEAKTQ